MTLDEIFEESWAFQELKEAYKTKAGKRGAAKGLQALCLIGFIEKYFPSLVQLARDIVSPKWTLEESQELFKKVVDTEDEQEVRQILLGAQK